MSRKSVRRAVHIALTSTAVTVAATVFAGAQTPSFAATASRPVLSFRDQTTQSILGTAYNLALTNLLDTNTVTYDPSKNTTGLMSGGTFVQAGAGYAGNAWTRDAAVNSWNAASLLEPQPAANSLWSQVAKQADGTLIVTQDRQQWDQVIWVTGAWNHYLVTGDQTFLANAYQAATNTLNTRKRQNLNAAYGLFQGPGFFNDGISGYPAPPADATESRGSSVTKYPGTTTMMTLSTNEVYYSAYRAAAAMATALNKPTETTGWTTNADNLKTNINKHLWNSSTGLYDHFVTDNNGTPQADHTEEGTGLSFAILFGIADTTQTRSIMQKAHIQPYGVVDTYPNYARYSDAQPGRHNDIVWPIVQGFWADAAATSGNVARFESELLSLAGLANTSGQFAEIYNAHTGAIDGGWQTTTHWKSEPDQTWSATAYLRIIYTDLFGMKLDTNGITFAPTLPSGLGEATLSGIAYRGATLTINLHGAGNMISAFTINGKPSTNPVPTSLTGATTIDITLTGAPGQIVGHGSLCLDDRSASTNNWNPIQIWACNGTAAQQWTISPADHTVRVLGKCLDVYRGNTTDRTPVQLYDCNSTGAQVWIPQPNGALKNPQSGRCLDDPNSSTNPGTQVQIHDCNGTDAQKWSLPA